MATLLETPPTRKAPKSFYCTLYDENGLLGKVDGVIYFFQPETGTITVSDCVDMYQNGQDENGAFFWHQICCGSRL